MHWHLTSDRMDRNGDSEMIHSPGRALGWSRRRVRRDVKLIKAGPWRGSIVHPKEWWIAGKCHHMMRHECIGSQLGGQQGQARCAPTMSLLPTSLSGCLKPGADEWEPDLAARPVCQDTIGTRSDG